MREIEYGVAPRLIAAVGGPTPGSVKGRHVGLLFVALSDRESLFRPSFRFDSLYPAVVWPRRHSRLRRGPATV
jgi:hypothetical protein